MSNRAAQAYDDGKLTYSKLPTWAKRMVDAGMAKTDEWHHTSSYGNETPFYEVKQFFDHLTDAEKEKLGVDDFESFKDVPKDVIKEIDVKSKEALKKKNNIKEVRKGYVDAAQKELNDFNAKFKSFSRVSKSPEHGIVSSYEMNGKYGWFEATSRYNLPEYQSGIDYETAANRQKAVELESKLSTAKNEPIYKIELQKRGFDENEINELKKSGIIHSEIMPESFYANAERNKDIIKKQVKELSELPKPVAEFNPRFGKSTENFLTDAEKQARQNRHYSISEQGENFGSSYERRLAHEDNDNEYSRIAGERYDKAKQEFLNSDEVQKQEEKFNEDKAKAADITGNLKHLFGIEDGQPLFKDAEAQYRIESGKNIIEAIKDFTKAENKAEATVVLTHEIIHPTVVAIIDGAKEGNEVGLKHTKTIVDEFNKKVRENNSQLKLSQDAAENEYANSKLTEEDNIEQEPSIKAIEGKAESDSKAELNEAIEQGDTKINAATDVKVVPIKFISTDEARFQNRDSLNKQVVKDIAENWKDADQDPIHIWTDPKNGKTYVLSGHHRYYGAKEAGRETVKTVDRTNDFTEAEAIKFAKEEANANRSMETSLERAKALREKIKRGDSKDEINKFLEREGKNKTYIQNIAALNPKGKTIQTVEQFDNAGDRQTQKETEQRADWIGEARRTINGLTDAHENEMFDFLFDKDASKRVTTKSDFLQKVRSVVKPLEPSEPLNIARFKQKTTGEEAYDEAVNIKKAEIADKQEKINTLNDRFSNPQNKDYISTDSMDYQELRKIANEKISQFESERKQLQKQLEDIYRDKGKYTGAASSGTLFKDDSEIPFDKEITAEDLIKWNDDFKAGKTNEQYRAVQEFIAKAWEEYNTKGGKGFSEAFQKFLDQITKAFQSVYKSITGKNLTPELNKMFDEILGKEQAKSIQETIDKKENVSLINKIKNYAAEVIANREKISRLSEQAEQGRKEGGIRNVEATLLLTTGGEKSGQVKGREAQQQIIEKYAKEEGIWHDNIDVEPKRGQTQEGIGIFKDSGVENQVYIPTENPHIVRKAMKTTDPFNKDNPNEVLYHLDSRISEHNAGLGSSVPYKVVGFGRMSDGSFVVITEQPHIQDARLATKAEIKKEMLNRGYEQDGKDSFGDENHFITDVNPKNVLVDKNGNLHFIDTIYDILYDVNEGDRAQMPKFNATTEAKGVTPEQTERANRILDFLKLTVAYFKGGKNIITDAKEYARAVLEIFEANNLEDIRHSFISNKNANLFSGSFNGKTLADNFNKAVEMDGNGEPSERIKFATGWYKAGDGKWRYEVTDKNAKLKVSLPNKGETIATKLEDILDHPRLFEIYPQLKNTDVIITNNNINSDYGGFFISEHGSNSTPTIHVNTRGEINATVSELIHEVQHNVQAISGLTPGNNNEAILGRLKDEFRSEHGRNPNTNEERKLFIEANREYLGTYGEIEARASQHNIHITENERLFNSTIAGTIKRFEIKPEDVSFPKQKIEINKVGNVINFLSTSQGEVYGFVSEGKMYLDPAKLTSELVTEEFTHIQQQALRLAAKQGDKKAQKIVSAWDNATNRVADEFIKGVRGNNMSEYVRDLLNLLGITKAEMASEVYQKQPNESAAAYKTRLQDELWAKAQKPEFAKHLEKLASENKLTAITRRIYEALKDFYRYVINRFTNEDLSKLSLLELIKRTNRELTKGNWLSVLEKGKSIVEAGNNMQAQAQQGQPLFMAVVGEKANLKQTVRDNLYTARQMEASKVDSNTIYLATGWERGNDGKWNYEIPDMQFKDNELIEKEITLVLENKKDHYEAQLSQIEGDNPLTERYPQLRGTILQFVYEPGVSFKGEYDANVQKVDGRMGTVISINTARLDEAVKQYGLDKEGGGVYSQRRLAAHSILIHELQHAIQDIEGFANGGNGAIARKIIFEKVENEIKNLAAYKTLLNKEQELQSQGKMWGDPEFEKLQDDIASFKIKYAAQMTKSGTLKESEYETYKSLTGEVQARNDQGRLKMTEAQRRQTAISETEDVSRKDQIIYFSNEGTVQKVNDMMEPNSKIQLQAQAKSTVTLERVKKAFNRLVNKTELVKNPKKEILRVSGLMVDLGFPEKQINAVAQTIGADAANLPEAERKIISEKAKKEFEEEKTSSFLEVLDTLSARNVEGNPDAIIDAADWKNTASNIGVDNKRLSSPDNPDTLVKDDRELTVLMSGETLKKAGIVFIDDNSLDAENDQLRVKFKLDQKANELENIYFTLGICKT